MWRAPGESSREVTCIACGETVARSEAREYDKHGDRWDRRDKEFEYLCKPCDGDRCHQPRGDLESRLVAAEAAANRSSFVGAYLRLVEEREGSLDE
jgi:hypothetical protein